MWSSSTPLSSRLAECLSDVLVCGVENIQSIASGKKGALVTHLEQGRNVMFALKAEVTFSVE